MVAHESTRKRLESSPPKDHEDHVAERGFNSMSHHNLAYKFVLMPQAMKIPEAKKSSGSRMGEVRKVASVAIVQNKEQKGGHSASTKRDKGSPFCCIDGHLSSQKMRSWNRSIKSTLDQSCSEVTL